MFELADADRICTTLAIGDRYNLAYLIYGENGVRRFMTTRYTDLSLPG